MCDRADVRCAMAAGVDDYLTKPFTADELLAQLPAEFSIMRRSIDSIKMRFFNMSVPFSTGRPPMGSSKCCC
jgi:DNA-binding response OmpR family regulator